MARKHIRAYPAELRLKIVEFARAGRGADNLAAEFNLSRQTVRNWIKQADPDAGRRSDGLTSAEHEELKQLRKRARQLETELETERQIISKAAARFVREIKVVYDPVSLKDDRERATARKS